MLNKIKSFFSLDVSEAELDRWYSMSTKEQAALIKQYSDEVDTYCKIAIALSIVSILIDCINLWRCLR